MEPIKVMVNGQPGNMATLLASRIVKTRGFELVPFSLTGPEIIDEHAVVEEVKVKLLPPKNREYIKDIVYNPSMIVADFTHPDAAVPNAQLYCDNNIPFIMGTTGADSQKLSDIVRRSSVSAVIAPNMGSQIVVLMAMFEWAAETFPGAFYEYNSLLSESHQKGKVDTSGTMKAMLKYLSKLGVECDIESIHMIREPEEQLKEGVPEKALGGHAFHTYTLISPDATTIFTFKHNVIGRDIYAFGAMDALGFLHKKVRKGSKGEVFSMVDVLKEG